jgi:photosystem II stability/assembly factor-like uncharacterized protein
LSDLGSGWSITDATYLAGGRVLLVTGAPGGVVRSVDGGRTWSPSGTGLPHGRVATVEADWRRPGRTWVGLDADGEQPGGLFRSDDAGRTWVPAETHLDPQVGATPGGTSRYRALAAAPTDPDVLYTSDLASGRRSVYRSEDGGRTWQRLPAPTLPFYQSPFAALVLAVSPDDPNRVLAAHEESLFATDDGGRTWTDVGAVPHIEGYVGAGPAGLTTTGLTFADDGTLAAQGTGGAGLLVRRLDGSWHSPLRDWDTAGGGYDTSTAGPVWWVVLGEGGRFNGIGRSTDNGLTWDVLAGGDLPERGAVLDPAPHSVLALSERTALVTLGGRALRTSNGGRSWVVVSDQVRGALGAIGQDPAVVLGAGPAGVLRSGDGGRTFDLLPHSPVGVEQFAVDRDGVVYAAVPSGSDAGVWRFQRGWHRLVRREGTTAIAVDPDNPARLAVGVAGPPGRDLSPGQGVLESGDRGTTWTRTDRGLAVAAVVAVAFDPGSGQVVAGTRGSGLYRLDPG